MLGRAWATWTGLLAVTLVGFFAPAPPSASAAEECRYSRFYVELPEYARAGGWIAIPAEYDSHVTVSGTVRVIAPGSAEAAYPLEVTSPEGGKFGRVAGQVVVPAPATPNPATRLILEWTESRDYGGGFPPYVCTGSAAAAIPIVPQGGEVGDPLVPRLEGRFRVSVSVAASGIPGVERATEHGVWRLRPSCRYFGCDTRVRSTLGLRGVFIARPEERHDYSMFRYFGRRATCLGTIVNRFTGEVIRRWKIRRAYYMTREIRLWIGEETSTGQVTRFNGRSVLHFEPIRSAARRGCPDKYVVERTRARLIRS